MTPDKKETLKIVNKCKYINKKFIKTAPENYKLLLNKYGGLNLEDVCSKINTIFTDEREVDYFLLEIHNIIKGLLFFQENNLIHYDIKPQNIVYNKDTRELRYIDFGLLDTKEHYKNLSRNSNNKFGCIFWNFPLDTGFINKDDYDYYVSNRIDNKIEQYSESLYNLISNNVSKSKLLT